MSTEPDDLDAFLAEKSTDPAFTLHWEALQATDRPATTDQQPKVYGATTDPADRRTPEQVSKHTDEQPWDEAGCSRRSCKDGHSHEMGRCAYGVEPPPTLARWKTFTASDGQVAIGTETLSAEQVAGWLREQGYTVAARASEAPGDVYGPTPDVGAARGGDDGSADESEPHVHYEVEAPRMIDGVKRWQYVETYADLIDARSHVDGCPAPDRIVRVTREVIQ